MVPSIQQPCLSPALASLPTPSSSPTGNLLVPGMVPSAAGVNHAVEVWGHPHCNVMGSQPDDTTMLSLPWPGSLS